MFGAKYRFDPEDDDALSIWDVAASQREMNNILLGIKIFLGIIGALTLIIAGVGVANIMYVSIKERTREIGIKMAVGARKIYILMQFLIEALIITFFGGFGGMLVSYILTEGFKLSDAPKIEVHRREVGPPLKGIKKLIATVTDEPLETKGRQFSPGDIIGLADFIEVGFIVPQRERLAVYVNGSPLSLSTFPRELVTNVLLAMVSSLKRVGRVRSLDISLRRASRGEPGK